MIQTSWHMGSLRHLHGLRVGAVMSRDRHPERAVDGPGWWSVTSDTQHHVSILALPCPSYTPILFSTVQLCFDDSLALSNVSVLDWWLHKASLGMRTEHGARHGLRARKGMGTEVVRVRKGKPSLPKCHQGYFVSCQRARPLLPHVLRASWASLHAPREPSRYHFCLFKPCLGPSLLPFYYKNSFYF